MAPTLPSNSSGFFAMPLEIRQQIYRLCIPENLSFACSDNMHGQNRPKGWRPPARPFNDDESGPYSYSGEGHYGPNGMPYMQPFSVGGKDTSEGEEYLPSRLDDYCQESQRHCPEIPPSSQSALPGLLLVCRQITDEATRILYGGNTFTFNVHHDGQSDLVRLFTPETREKMRKMIVVLRPMGISYYPKFRMERQFWDGVLGNLSILGIIIEQPSSPVSFAWATVKPEDVLKEWTAWFTPILEYLGQALPGTAQIIVDANKEQDTIHVVEKVMPGRCCLQRLRAADSIFRRGKFYPMSACWIQSESCVQPEIWNDISSFSCRSTINDTQHGS